MDKNYFEILNAINVNDKTEKKNNLTYLSWAWAWAEIKKLHPTSTYTIYENANGWNYHTDGRTCWVKTGVTISDVEHIEYLPVMDYKNQSIPTERVTSFDVNKAIQRSLTKAVARHGLGLYIYAGEDLPEEGGMHRQQADDLQLKINKVQLQALIDLISRAGSDQAKVCKAKKVDKLDELTVDQWIDVTRTLEARVK